MDTTKQYKVISTEVIKQGTGQKGPWTLYGATVEGSDTKPAGFTPVQPGDFISVEAKQNGQYTNYNYTKVDGAPTASAAPVSAATTPTGDPSLRKMLGVLIALAEQMGVPKERIMEALEK